MEKQLTYILLRCCYWRAYAECNPSISGDIACAMVIDEADRVDIDSSQALALLARAESTQSHHDKLLIALNLFKYDESKAENSHGVGAE